MMMFFQVSGFVIGLLSLLGIGWQIFGNEIKLKIKSNSEKEKRQVEYKIEALKETLICGVTKSQLLYLLEYGEYWLTNEELNKIENSDKLGDDIGSNICFGAVNITKTSTGCVMRMNNCYKESNYYLKKALKKLN